MTHTLRNVRRDFPEWHKGRTHYALWALSLDTAPVRRRVQAAQTHLHGRLLPGYQRQPHVTLGLCGFLSTAALHDDDFDVQALRLQLHALRQTRPAPFGICVGGLDSFASVPFLSVQADAAGTLATLRQCLATSAMDTPAPHYVPHVTVGLYADVWPLADLQAQFRAFTDTQALPLRVRSISLLCYAAKEIGGPLQTLAEYDLASGALHWRGNRADLPPAFEAMASGCR